MKKCFDEVVDRTNTGSWKWDEFSEDVLPMWIADMDFRAPECVRNALHKAVDHGVFGYSQSTEKLDQIILNRLLQKHNIAATKQDLIYMPGLVSAINLVCKCAGEPGDEILVPTPAYPPFLMAPANQKRSCLKVPMLKTQAGWEFDFDAMEARITNKTKAILLCNPHNPTGRVLSREELERFGELAIKHDLIICSDEIHCDLVLDSRREHVSIASLGKEISDRTITLLAPSKTYNIAGLGFSFAVVTNPELRARFAPTPDGLVPHVNGLGFVAGEAAYEAGEPWRVELVDYLRENLNLVEQMISELDGVSIIRPEATYLAWIDCSGLGLKDPSQHFLKHKLGLGFGSFFGMRQYVRLNFACPRATLLEGLTRFKKAVESCRK